MLDPAGDAVLVGKLDEFIVMRKKLGCRFCDQNMHLALQCIFGDRVVSAYVNGENSSMAVCKTGLTVRCEDDDRRTRLERINRGHVCHIV